MTYWSGKSAIVTGGSAGLGKAIAAALLADGARVGIVGRDRQRLAAAAGELSPDDSAVATFAADLTQQSDVDRLFGEAPAELAGLDLLVNCAGRSMRGKLLETEPETFSELLDINLLAVVRCCRAAAPLLVESKGHVVNIGSLAAKTASPWLGAYPASKHALAGYTHQLRLELEPEGPHVLLVCPGPIARDDAGHRYQDQAKDLPAGAERPGGARLRSLDPAWLSKKVLRACEKRKAELIVPGKARLLFALSQLWPRWGDRVVRRKTSGR